MTTANAFVEDWASHPIGKITRALVAIIGVVLATLVLLLASMGTSGVWVFILLGLALAATSVRAALNPTVIRLATLGAVMIAVPIVGQII
jgi:hypothetical protein